jgi:hypothetical protein
MGELRMTIHERLADAYEAIRSARTVGDEFMIEARKAEIEDLHRIALDHDIELPRQY